MSKLLRFVISEYLLYMLGMGVAGSAARLEVGGLHLLAMDLWLPKIAPSSVTLFPCLFSPDPWPGDLLILHADGLHTVILGLSEAVTVAAGERACPLG